MGQERIDVYYKPLIGNAYHKYVVYTDSEGNQTAYSGFPENGPMGPVTDGEYGNLVTTWGEYAPGYPGYPEEGVHHSHENIVTADDLSPV